MDDYFSGLWADLIGRTGGLFSFRFVLQPIMAAVMGIRDGLKDAEAGRAFYTWSVLHDQAKRWTLLREGWASVLRIILLGAAMDTAYQLITFKAFYPLELVLIVLVLAFVPYLVIRGPVNRFLHQRWERKAAVPR